MLHAICAICTIACLFVTIFLSLQIGAKVYIGKESDPLHFLLLSLSSTILLALIWYGRNG